jgi:hypothetical protein
VIFLAPSLFTLDILFTPHIKRKTGNRKKREWHFGNIDECSLASGSIDSGGKKNRKYNVKDW